ncbi:hypothetical protein NLJ89_g5997 [Agrocybe chaxingu]|uniref:MYND-type domain-containing protein n=1 Tax=Agrocybe chaxingu TaxID=84603 RepID=A0A9W8JZ67_9AGAR|nr:hypothetical protein NLJ89_g5997 [Agrocybe chaxingu]
MPEAEDTIASSGKPEGVYYLSEKDLKKTERHWVISCFHCGKRDGEGGIAVKKCVACLKAAYCSKECQRAAWPNHKRQCGTLGVATAFATLVQHLLNVPVLLHYLRVALVFRLSLLQDRQADKCQTATFNIFLMPFKDEDIFHLAYTKEYDVEDDKHKIPARVNVFLGPKIGEIDVVATKSRTSSSITQQRKDDTNFTRIWKRAKAEASAAGRAQNPIVLVNFAYETHDLCHAIEITENAFETAQGNVPPFALPPSMTTGKLENAHSALDVVNQLIGADVAENRFKLQANMRKYDKQVLRDLKQ